ANAGAGVTLPDTTACAIRADFTTNTRIGTPSVGAATRKEGTFTVCFPSLTLPSAVSMTEPSFRSRSTPTVVVMSRYGARPFDGSMSVQRGWSLKQPSGQERIEVTLPEASQVATVPLVQAVWLGLQRLQPPGAAVLQPSSHWTASSPVPA